MKRFVAGLLLALAAAVALLVRMRGIQAGKRKGKINAAMDRLEGVGTKVRLKGEQIRHAEAVKKARVEDAKANQIKRDAEVAERLRDEKDDPTAGGSARRMADVLRRRDE